MKNDLYRKLTSITLMTIMFAGGMTIAIPGELPTAVAQTNTLSVSASAAGVFGGAQVIEIVIDDPDLDEILTAGTEAATKPDVEVDDTEVIYETSNHWKVVCVCCRQRGVFGQSSAILRVIRWPASPYAIDLPGFLSGAPTPVADCSHRPWAVQTFDFDGDVEITATAAASRSPWTTTITATSPR